VSTCYSKTRTVDSQSPNFQHDTKLVAILYRTHKSLSSTAKVSSLYAFDALARAARSYASKRGITGDINSSIGNAATFLLKVEGVLDGLFQDMIVLDNTEAKVSDEMIYF
jgi:protein NRD1